MKLVIIAFLLFISALVHKPIHKNYEIVNKEKDNKGFVNRMDVYVQKMSDIKSINKILFAEYNKAGSVALTIYYYDNKEIAKTYVKKLFDKKTTDKQVEVMSQHVIGKFEYILFDNTKKLHIGKNADDY
ncbi:hypothetical protein [Pedobacter cryoconitis]|uniref:Uncharacterized protein n=1 Tax=Pedobacter cryoconitis TaxID=188932 RepID=A0A7X0IZZ0_9SPHI|nr:hypothetical protein [Pedobacter cryoconitis]MBB6498278.1 hypothetical protein [Pedobacter cryoconitis]